MPDYNYPVNVTPTVLRQATNIRLAVFVASLLLFSACASSTKPQLDARLGGDTTREYVNANAFGLSAPEMSSEDRRIFERGDSFFTKNWVSAPASTDARDGLGPTYNALACSSCHAFDGRGAPPDPTGADANLGLLYRLSVPGNDPVTGANNGDPTYGGQLQDNANIDVPAEGQMLITYSPIEGTYGDGSSYELSDPHYAVTRLAFGPLSDEVMIGPRLGPQVIGMGLLGDIPDADLLAAADPDDTNDDGISGRVNMVWDGRLDQLVIGRFGWKANVATVEQQVAGAFSGDIGITSALHPDQNCPAVQVLCNEAISGGEPELTDDRLASVTFYNRTLSVPAMRDVEDEQVQRGFDLFVEFGCASCHTVTQRTLESDLDVLDNQTFHPYTDLLLHDMGDGLADGRPDFDATGSEWRTPPLWGVGLIDEVNGERFLLHDGRARTFEEAILWHGGEAADAAEQFRLADLGDREALLAFLEAL